MSMPLLKSIKCTLITSFIVGIAPFTYKKSRNRMECGTISLLYTIFIKTLTVSLVMLFLVTGWFSKQISTKESFYLRNPIINYANKIMHTIIPIASFSMLFVTIMTRHLNVRLLNGLQANDTAFTLLVTDKPINYFHKSVNIQLAAAFCYFLLSTVSFLFWPKYLKTYYNIGLLYAIAFQVIAFNTNAIYMRYIAKILTNRFDVLKMMFGEYVRTALASKIQLAMKMTGNVVDLKRLTNQTFGWNFVINSTMEFIIITVATFTCKLNDESRFLIMVYILPNFVKMVMLVAAFNRLGNQVSIFSR